MSAVTVEVLGNSHKAARQWILFHLFACGNREYINFAMNGDATFCCCRSSRNFDSKHRSARASVSVQRLHVTKTINHCHERRNRYTLEPSLACIVSYVAFAKQNLPPIFHRIEYICMQHSPAIEFLYAFSLIEWWNVCEMSAKCIKRNRNIDATK